MTGMLLAQAHWPFFGGLLPALRPANGGLVLALDDDPDLTAVAVGAEAGRDSDPAAAEGACPGAALGRLAEAGSCC